MSPPIERRVSDPVSPTMPPAESAPAQAGARPRAPRSLIALGGVVLAVLSLAAAALVWQRTDAVGREAARRMQVSDQRAGELQIQLRQSQDLLRDLQSRSAVMENKLTESLGQVAQLERMYRDIAQDSVGTVLAEVENAVAIASQQLLVSGNLQGALVAMQDADARLKRIRQPEALGLRRLIARDIERLKAAPSVDVVSLAIRLDSVTSGIDQLPLLSALSRPEPAASGAGAGAPTPAGFSLERLASSGRRGWQALVDELTQLFRVNRVDSPDALLLAPSQQYFVRENLRLVLLSARLSLLSRSEPLLRADLTRALRWLDTYYDRQSRAVTGAEAALRQLQEARIVSDLPSLGDTLAAVRAARAARESSR